MSRTYDLPALGDTRKSFYGKAKVIEKDDCIELQSYNTIVCKIENGKLKRLWNDYSATTMRHIIAFCKFFNIDCGGKQWWLGLKVE